MLTLLLALACGPSTPPVSTPEVTVPPPTPTEPAVELNGIVPAEALPIPTFSATAHNGEARGPEALQGHVTVLWFLPAANTGG